MTNETGEPLLTMILMLSRSECEEILIALDMRRRQIGSTSRSTYNEELGNRLAASFENRLSADPGWWQRIKAAAYKVKIITK